MSGHNKWSKIKHKKGAEDSKRSKLFSNYAKLITLEAQQAAGNRAAAGLTAVVERAKKDGVPKDNIERAIARGFGEGGTALEQVTFETYGPGGIAILITAVTDNNNRTSPEIKHLLSKYNCILGAQGSAAWAFTKTESGYTPTTPIELSDDDGEKLATLIEALEEHDDVQDVYTTADSE